MIISNALKTLGSAIPFAFVALFGDDPGRIEGRILPVAKNYQLIKVDADSAGIHVDMLFQKVRDCKFHSLDFYILNNSHSWVEVPVVFPEDGKKPASSRPQGVYEVNWTLSASETLADNPMKVVTHHQCWGAVPWDVETASMISR